MNRIDEVREKRSRLRRWLDAEGLDAVLLGTQTNFAWYTAGGSNKVVMGVDAGAATILADGDKDVVFTDNIESPRIAAEELSGLDGFSIVETPWHDEKAAARAMRSAVKGRKVASDSRSGGGMKPLPGSFEALTYSLTEGEVERYRALGKDCSGALSAVGSSIEPGMTEDAIAGHLARGLLERGVTPWVILVAADERVAKYRHPTPTANKLKKHAMLVICGRRGGLILSATRMVHFGRVPPELRGKHDAVVQVDVAFNSATVPGRKVAEVFDAGLRAYEKTGFPDEWRKHHQGGPTGYQGRSYKGAPGVAGEVLPNQAYAWNPSIAGTKSEDTILATERGIEFLSVPAGWPVIEVSLGDGSRYARPDILVR